MGLAASVRDRNDYDEQGGKEKQAVPVVQLNLICTVVDLSVAIRKSEVVDMILPLFIESLEEGNASTAGLLQIRLLDAVSHIASIDFEKSFCETVVLMTRSYLGWLSSLGSAGSETLAWEATTERVDVVSSVTWLEDELEFNALHNPGSRRESGNVKAAVTHSAALSAALGGQVDVGGMSTISGWLCRGIRVTKVN
ncbi:phosphatidylinositol 4-kinase alpha 1-like isoform X2 [Syzygium oleosum]|uniref:phosphatidylinositol 4-kinase alpha 1-like isoform X2 n=1 Tax=Syzygium oleosum TaxID=219896 RepID=UPI0024B90B50|nr:phosphatidylinositol 4-kinase alpha 1-like isoform X2 [Syzygium oleosum]